MVNSSLQLFINKKGLTITGQPFLFSLRKLYIRASLSNESIRNTQKYLQQFTQDISGIALPQNFTFPFYYDPHPLTQIAAEELQNYLEEQTDIVHNFGIGQIKTGTPQGKMFGVLVVQNNEGALGYLAGFSGELDHSNIPNKFAPRIFDLFSLHSTYPQGQLELIELNKQIDELEKDPIFLSTKENLALKTPAVSDAIQKEKEKMKQAKTARKLLRTKAALEMRPEEFSDLKESLAKESVRDKFLLKQSTIALEKELDEPKHLLEEYTSRISELKTKRKNTSNRLQKEIFDNYIFLNQQKVKKTLTEIFPIDQGVHPPAGAGDCVAPKLLQHAFLYDLKPIAMGEFWWGASPSAEIRKHKVFYPACTGRCKPILAHMLDGITLDKNPLLKEPEANKEIDILFEDESILIINKPHELLSVPGKTVSDSVYTRIRTLHPNATGPLIIHRLDGSTSGLLIIAKTKEAHKAVQRQFVKRTIKKRYIAILDGIIEKDEGEISLPLRVDLDDRPRQLVCNEHGKEARTKWKVIKRQDGKTRVHLYPMTGRTHQLRVHVSHPLGLHTAIVGDDLYGTKGDRLHLHAESIEFIHPSTKETMCFSVEAQF